MKNIVPIIAIVLIFTLLMITVACNTNQVITSLEVVVTAAEVALPIVASQVGLPPATLAAILTYLKSVNVAIGESSTILSSTTLTTIQKSEQVVLLFTSLAKGCNCLPAGTPQVVVGVIDSVVRAIANFLANVKPTVVSLPPGTVVGSRKAMRTSIKVKVSASDKARLDKVKARAMVQVDKIK
jgi:hypothetical protein